MTALATTLRRVADGYHDAAQADTAEPSDLLAALDFNTALDDIRRAARALVVKALRAGVDQRDLYGKPFSRTVVLQIAEEHGLKDASRGPRPRKQATAE
jgi:hypothetical protein